MRKQTIYFAHPVAYYNTPREAEIVAMLEEKGWEVLNPNAQEHQDGYATLPEEIRFTYFEKLARSCDAIAYWAFDNGKLGAGVAKEVLEAIVHGKPSYYVGRGHRNRNAGDTYFRDFSAKLVDLPVMTIDETRAINKRIKGGSVKATEV